jgi:hypothetical protein
MFIGVFDIIFTITKASNLDYSKRKVDVGIDFTDWRYYGKKDDEELFMPDG